MKYRLDLPSTVSNGIVITNGDATSYTESYLNGSAYYYGYNVSGEGIAFTSPPILMKILNYEAGDIEDCFTANPEDWIADFKSEMLQNKMLFWRLSEVSFSRKSTRLRFCNDGGGTEDLYISQAVAINLEFTIYCDGDIPWATYTLQHDKAEGNEFVASSLVKRIGNKVKRIYEFCTEPTNKATRFSEYVIITEFH